MKISPVIGSFCLLAVLCGCEPKERAAWSPDGQHAAVILKHRLHLTDAEGGLVDQFPDRDEKPGRLLVEGCRWLPDGEGLVLHRLRITARWEEMRPLIPEDEAVRVEALVDRMPELLRAAVILHGDADRAEILLAKLSPEEGERVGNALRQAFVSRTDAVKEALAGAPRALASLERRAEDEWGFVAHELVLAPWNRESGFGAAKVLSRESRAFSLFRVSPQYPVVACARPTGKTGRVDLEIRSLDGSFFREVGRGLASAFDWTPDGLSLATMTPLDREGGALMQVGLVEVIGKDGRPILEEGGGKSGYPEWRRLAVAAVPFAPRLAVLPGGEVLFASQPGSLPTVGFGSGGGPRLYLLPTRGEGGGMREIPTAEGALPMDLGYFVPSPDGRRVAVVESETDAVAVVELDDGKVTLVSGPHPGWKCRTLPTWRSDGELAYASLDVKTGKVRWIGWQGRGEPSRILSQSWPESATDEWLEFQKPEKAKHKEDSTITP